MRTLRIWAPVICAAVLAVTAVYFYWDGSQAKTDIERLEQQTKKMIEATFKDAASISEEERAQRSEWEELFRLAGQDIQEGGVKYRSIPEDNDMAISLLPAHSSPIAFHADDTSIQIVYKQQTMNVQLHYYPDEFVRKIIEPPLAAQGNTSLPLSFMLINDNNEQYTTYLIERSTVE